MAEAGLLEAAQFRARGCTSQSARCAKGVVGGTAQLPAAEASEAAATAAAAAELASAPSSPAAARTSSPATARLRRFAEATAPNASASASATATASAAASATATASAAAAGPEAAEALGSWLDAALAAYNARFQLASNRSYSGLTPAEEGEWCGAYDFVQLADPQLGMLHMDRSWAEELTMLKLAIDHVNRLRPRFLLISGDLTNAWPCKQNARVVAAQVASFHEALRELDPSIPLVLQPGNHDVGQNPSAGNVAEYCARFGDDYFSFWVGGVKYISINSQYYHILCVDNPEADALEREQAAWVESEMSARATAGAAHVVILSHITPFMGAEDEEVGHFNWKRVPREWMVGLCSQPHLPGGRATLWLCGHYHASCAVHSRAGTEVVTTGAVGGVINWSQPPQVIATQPVFQFMECVNSPPVTCDAFHSGMRVCRVRRNRIDHRFLELNAVPRSIEEVFAMSDDDALALRDDARNQMLGAQLELLSLAMDLPDTPDHVRGKAELD